MMLQAGHYDPEAIRNCAEKVAVHWQQLMLKMEDRLKLVNASVAFYKTSEQVHSDHDMHSQSESGSNVHERGVLSRCAACWRAWSRSIAATRTGAAVTINWECHPTATTFYL